MAAPANPVTRLRREWSQGNASVLEELTPLVYQELHRLAAGYLRRERPDHTLQPTALIHEAYLRLVDQAQPEWQSRSHFFRFAAQIMRQILVDHARLHAAAKRGGAEHRAPIEQADVFSSPRGADLIALDEALTALAAFDERKARVLELRFFGGLTLEEASEAL